MTRIRRLPTVLLPLMLIIGGALVALAGVYLLAGLAIALIVGGVAAVAAGLLVEF